MREVEGSQYGSFWFLALAMVVPVAICMSVFAAATGLSDATPIACSVVMVGFAWVLHRNSRVRVEDDGIVVKMMAGTLEIPWSDIESLEAHPLTARLLRRSNGKRVVVQILDPGWRSRPVGRAITARLRSDKHQREIGRS